MEASARQWIARLLVAAVFAMNVMCAIQFITNPTTYVSSYELDGPGALAAIQGMGIVYLMWNATYPPVIVQPCRYRILFVVVLAQQAIGLIGELLILLSLQTNGPLNASLLRFILFDTLGMCALVAAFALSCPKNKSCKTS